MTQAYLDGKDLYATVAAGVFKNKYEDNKEFYPDGRANPEGSKRRSFTKSILLGLMYGRGAASIADQTHSSIKEAQKIIDDFYKEFPKVKYWIDKTESDARKNGYVEDLWGRRRRLPDILLPDYTVKDRGSVSSFTVNPLLGCKNLVSREVNPKIQEYEKKLKSAKGWQQVKKIKEAAAKDNIDIHDNTMFVSQAVRQCVNARIQGGAASMSKLAMVKVHHDPELRKLGFRILLQVHDELIGECPSENAKKAAERLSYVMKHAAEPVVKIPFKCDAVITRRWYEDQIAAKLKEKYEQIKDTKDYDSCINELVSEFTPFTRDEIVTWLNSEY